MVDKCFEHIGSPFVQLAVGFEQVLRCAGNHESHGFREEKRGFVAVHAQEVLNIA